jgi:hypothetical protein
MKAQDVTYFFLAVFLAVLGLIVLNYVGFYVHEFGTSSSAALWTMTKQESTLTLNYEYDTFLGFLKVPRSVIPGLPWHFAILATVIAGLVLLCLAVLIGRWRQVKHHARRKAFIFIAFGILFVKDVLFSLGCRLYYCNSILTAKIGFIADILILLALCVFFVDIVFAKLKYVEIKKKEEKA